MLSDVPADVRCAVRSLARGGVATMVAVLSLTIGIAANTTMFSLVHALEFPPLIYPDASRLVFLESRNHLRGISGMLISQPDAVDLARSTRTLQAVAVAGDQSSVLRQDDGSQRVSGRRVTTEFFIAMAVQPALGRTFDATDGDGAIVLSDALWRARFGGDASAVGRTIRLDGGTVVIVGVMPPRFDPDAEFWTQLRPSAAADRADRQFYVFARLAPNVSIEEAAADLTAISARLAADHAATNQGWEMYPVALRQLHGRDARQPLFLLQAAVFFLLLIACANIANLLLARASTRRQELAVRLSLGATRGRLVRSLLTESLLLALIACAAGVLLATWGLRVARSMDGITSVLEPELNLWVLSFTMALGLLCALGCGLLPALQSARLEPNSALQSETRGIAGPSHARARASFVVAQIAIAMVLVTCGALMVRTLVNRLQVDLGFNPRGVVHADVPLVSQRYASEDSRRAFVEQILERTRRQASVVSAGVATWALPSGAGGQRAVVVPGQPETVLPSAVRRGFNAVTPGYFEALEVPLRAGRLFTAADTGGAAPVAIVNEELARRLFSGRNPVGHLLRLGTTEEAAPLVTIVGVVGDTRRSVMHDAAVAHVYVPYAQHPGPMPSLYVRSRGAPGAALMEVREAARALDPDLLLDNLQTMSEQVDRFVAPVRVQTWLLAVFGGAGLLLAASGVFAAMSFVVSQRQREMAVRVAIGASPRDIVRLQLGSVVRITLIGIVIGTLAAALAARTLSGVLFGVTPLDPLTFVVVMVLLGTVALLAAYRPARNAASADPLTLLR